jgi:hypothetical protein
MLYPLSKLLKINKNSYKISPAVIENPTQIHERAALTKYLK